MNKFSIAPWKLSHSHSHEYIRYVRDAQGEHIAHVCDLEDAAPEAIANAKMMAAAPQLLAALRDLLDEADLNEVDEYTAPKIEAARAAITAATGDQTLTA